MCYYLYNSFSELRLLESQGLSVSLSNKAGLNLSSPFGHSSSASFRYRCETLPGRSFVFGVSVLTCKCYKPAGSVFQVLCLCWPSSYRFAGSQTHIWVSGGGLKPSKRFACLRQNTLFFFYCFIF